MTNELTVATIFSREFSNHMCVVKVEMELRRTSAGDALIIFILACSYVLQSLMKFSFMTCSPRPNGWIISLVSGLERSTCRSRHPL